MAFGGWEWIIIGLAVLMLFGGKQIPKLARGIGESIREFRNTRNEITESIKEADSSK